jgi:hypothetical protein
MAHQTRKNIKNFNKTRIKKRPRSNRHTLKKGGLFKHDFNAAKSKLAEGTGNIGQVIGKGILKTGKILKGVAQIATDIPAYALAAMWRLFNNRFFVVLGLKAFRQLQADKMLNEKDQAPIIKLPNFDKASSKYKNDIYPNFHENDSYYGIKEGSVYVTPIGVGSVFIFKKAFNRGTSKNKELKDSTATEIYKPTSYYIVIKIELNENSKPTAMHYREIRFDGNNYFIGQFPYEVTRTSNTIRFWMQIRVFELNIGAITSNYQQKFIQKSTGGGQKEDLQKRIKTMDVEIDDESTPESDKNDLLLERIRLSDELVKLIQGEKQQQWRQQSERRQPERRQPEQQQRPRHIGCVGNDCDRILESRQFYDRGNGTSSSPTFRTIHPPYSSDRTQPLYIPRSPSSSIGQMPVIAYSARSQRSPSSITSTSSGAYDPVDYVYPKYTNPTFSITDKSRITSATKPQEKRELSPDINEGSHNFWSMEWKKNDDYYINKYTKEETNDTEKIAKIKADECNILNYFTTKGASTQPSDLYCFKSNNNQKSLVGSAPPISNLRQFQKFLIFLRHIANPNNWQMQDDVQYKYKYDFNMKSGYSSCTFLPDLNDDVDTYYTIDRGSDEARDLFSESELPNLLDIDTPIIFKNFSVTLEDYIEDIENKTSINMNKKRPLKPSAKPSIPPPQSKGN